MRDKNETKERYSRYIAGSFLVILGVLLFLNVLGVINFAVWRDIAVYWPIGLIIIGVALILRMRILAISFLFITLLLLAIYFIGLLTANYIVGSGNITTRNYEAQNFTGVVIEVPAHVYVSPGEQYSVSIKGDDNILEMIEVDSTEGDAHIRYAGKRFSFNMFDPSRTAVYITSPNITSIEMDSAGNIKSNGTIRADRLEVMVKGAGDMDLDVDTHELVTSVSGFGNMHVDGKTSSYSATISGAGDIDAYGLESENATVRISGTGNAKINVTKYLDASVSGAGNIIYTGEPQVKQIISGVGNIKKE